MIAQKPLIFRATRLLQKAIRTNLAPANDQEYRDLLAQYRADPAFSTAVEDAADGLDLLVLEASERGLVIVPASKDSPFAWTLAQLRQSMSPEQRAALFVAHMAVAAAFFPNTDGLDDDNYFPPPVSVAAMRDALYSLSCRLRDSAKLAEDFPEGSEAGWALITALPLSTPGEQRANLASVVGLVKTALSHLVRANLIRQDRAGEDEANLTYTATHALRVHLRDLGIRRTYELAQGAITQSQEA